MPSLARVDWALEDAATLPGPFFFFLEACLDLGPHWYELLKEVHAADVDEHLGAMNHPDPFGPVRRIHGALV